MTVFALPRAWTTGRHMWHTSASLRFIVSFSVASHMSRLSVVLALLVGTALPAAALDDPKGYTCTFSIGAAHAYAKGRFKPTRAGPVTLDIANINHAKQEAELVSGERRSMLRIIRAVNAVHFLEAVGEGYLNLTTIYDRDVGTAAHPAVHSRHFGLLGQPIVSQYRGVCLAKG